MSDMPSSEQAVRLVPLPDAVAVIELCRPKAKNSLRLPDMALLGQLIDQALASGARCLLLRGIGGAFCAGRDLKETDPEHDDTLAILTQQINPVLMKLRQCPIPTLAAVQGPALGFGFGLALACDITLVADNAILGSPFRNIGAVLDSGGHFFLRERLGNHRASELIFTGRMLSGREAAAIGLVNRAVGAAALDQVAEAMARQIATGPTGTFITSKDILSRANNYEQALALEALGQDKALKGHDGREGIRAFQERRTPRFIGQ